MRLRRRTKLRIQIAVSIFVLFLGFFYLGVLSFSDDEEKNNDECIKVSSGADFIFDACYDLATETIFLDVKRSSFSSYDVVNFEITYVDDDVKKSFKLSAIPGIGESNTLNFPSEKNPNRVELLANLADDVSKDYCVELKRVYVRDCIRESSKDPIREEQKLNINITYTNKEEFWKGICDSDWSCGEWGECLGGVQRRDCIDGKKCILPIDSPRETRYCSGACQEDWECAWSVCESGFSTPTCYDKNKCGTNYNEPGRIRCNSGRSCVPDIECGEWSECKVDYTFIDFEERREFDQIKGERTRLCEDLSSCLASVAETQECSTNLDVFIKPVSKCGQDYVEVYNELGGELIGRLKEAEEDSPLRISLGDNDLYCDHCYNNKLDEDEEDIDCGGENCIPCEERKKVVGSRKIGFFIWLKNLFF